MVKTRMYFDKTANNILCIAGYSCFRLLFFFSTLDIDIILRKRFQYIKHDNSYVLIYESDVLAGNV